MAESPAPADRPGGPDGSAPEARPGGSAATVAAPAGPTNMGAARETAVVFASLAIGHLLNLVSLSLISSRLGLVAFGNYGLCLIDFAVFANLGNFILPAASIPYAAKEGLTPRAFSVVGNARLRTTAIAVLAYLAFETLFRSDADMRAASFILAAAIVLNPVQLEWWSVARRSFTDLLVHRLVSGSVTLILVLTWVRISPSLFAAAGAYAGGMAAGFLALAWRIRIAGGAGFAFLAWNPAMGALLRSALPVALAGLCDFLFLPLGYYAFRYSHGEGPLLGAYGTAHRLALAGSLAASSLFLILLPRFSRRAAAPEDRAGPDEPADAKTLADRPGLQALILLPGLLLAPPLARPVLRLLFPATDWSEASLDFGAWALACMTASIALHLLRMGPLTRALAEGRSWLYAGAFFAAGAINIFAVVLGGRIAGAEATGPGLTGVAGFLPALSLAADAAFTAWWLGHGARARPVAAFLRVVLLAAGLAAYLAWARSFA